MFGADLSAVYATNTWSPIGGRLGFKKKRFERVFHRDAEKLFAPQLQKTLQTQH